MAGTFGSSVRMKSGYERPVLHSTRSALAARRSRWSDARPPSEACAGPRCAPEHQLGCGLAGHQGDLRVPALDRKRRAELSP